MLHQQADHRLAQQNLLQIHQRGFQPAAQAAAAHGGEGLIDGPEQRALQLTIPLGGGELQVATGLGIEHQGIAAVNDLGNIEGDARLLVEGLSVVHVLEQSAEGTQGQGQFLQAQAIETGQAVMGFKSLSGFGGTEGGACHRAEPQPFGTPGGFACARLVAGLVTGGPEQFRGVQLGQLLMQCVAAVALHHPHVAGAHVGAGQSPTQGMPGCGRLHHDGCKPVVAPGRQHSLFQDRAWGEHTGDAAFEQSALGGRGLQLIAEGHGIAAADQFGAVARSGVVRDAGHGYAADRFTPFLAREGEFQHPRELDGVFEEAFEEVAKAVQQHALGMLSLELHVVAQHRRQQGLIHFAVVGPGRSIAVEVVVFDLVAGRLRLVAGVDLPLPRASCRIGAEAGIAEVLQLCCDASSVGSCGWLLCRIGAAEQIALQGQLLRLGSGAGHRTRDIGWIVPMAFTTSCEA